MISIIGSINIDLVATAKQLPRCGETILADEFSVLPGGKGANQALAARRAGADTALYGVVGNDAFREPALELLTQAGVNLGGVRRVDSSTGTALIMVDDAGDNMISVVGGANTFISAADVDNAIGAMRAGDTLLMQFEIDAALVTHALEKARGKGIRTILNTAPMVAGAERALVHADVVIANQLEFAALCGDDQPLDDCMSRLRRDARYRDTAFVVTLGASGAIGDDNGRQIESEALAVEAIDTVGAGDTFAGFLAGALDAELGLDMALRRATVAGSLACLNRGAQQAIPCAADIDAALVASR